jgi:arylsulfatase A-like enzyme
LIAINASAAEPSGQPNIVVILADDLGYGDVHCFNPESRIPTPNLDQLAAQGMRFTDAHSPSTVCTPTRYSLLTGRMAFRTGYRGVFTGVGGPNMIEASRLTLPGMLKQHGYRTAMFGKWHVGMTFLDSEGKPINQGGLQAVTRVDYSRPVSDAPIYRGFDKFFGTVCCPTTDWLYAYMDGDRIPVPPSGLLDQSTLPKHSWSFDNRRGMVAPDFDLEEVDMVFLGKSQEFLREHARSHPRQPFFLFHSMQAVHLPSFPGKDFRGKTKSGPHGDFIFELDHIVGELMSGLRENGFDKNTLVIFSSDNGPEVGTVIAMRDTHGHDGARPWRGMKRDNWEAGHRVPTIAWWPGQIEADSVTDQTFCLTDLMATCASIVGARLPSDAAEDSFDFSTVLRGQATEPIRPYTLHQTISLALAIRRGPWKYLDHIGSGGNNYANNPKLQRYIIADHDPDAPAQLYNLENDPGETRNLYSVHPEIVAELKELLDKAVRSGRSAPERK